MSIDPFIQFKAAQREAWASFISLESLTTQPAGSLVKFSGIAAGESVLDVACGTGVVAVTAARSGAKVSGLDLSPVLLTRARENAALAGVDIDFAEGDAETLPYPDASFDAVLSQFGHLFAPRPQVVIAEMLRVLKPGGRIAFSTWPPDQFVGRMFAFVAEHMPMGPPGLASPAEWGDPRVVQERLGDHVTELSFDRDTLFFPVLSPAHYRRGTEVTSAPIAKLTESLRAEPEKLARFQAGFEALIAIYFADNRVRQHFLMTRAKKR